MAFFIFMVEAARLPVSLLRSTARTRASQQSPGLFLFALQIALFNSRFIKIKTPNGVFYFYGGGGEIARLASALDGTHAGIATVPRTVSICFANCPVQFSLYKNKNAKWRFLFLWWRRRELNSRPELRCQGLYGCSTSFGIPLTERRCTAFQLR